MKYLLMIVMSFNILWSIEVKELLVKMENAGEYKTAKMEATMKIVSVDGDKTSMKLLSYEQKGEIDRSLMRFLEPARLKYSALLSVGENMWYYNHRSGRTRLLTKSKKKGSFAGSNFSYEDMNMKFAEDFTGTIDSEDENYYFLVLIPNDKDLTYKKMKMKVRKVDFLAEHVEYYDESDAKFKEMWMLDFVVVDDHPTALTIKMTSLSDGKTTYFITDKNTLEFDFEIDKSIFSDQNLKM